MAQKRIIKCISCGVFNENRSICKNCGAILSHKQRREQKLKQERQKKTEALKNQPPGYIERLRQHRFFLYRAFGYILYSGFVVVSAIGAFIAWLVFAIAAG